MAASSGKYYSDVRQGNCYIGTTVAAGTAYPITTDTAMTFGLWNVSTNKNAVLLSLNMGYTSGTIALGQVGLTIVHGGWALGTPISAFTDGTFGTTIRNALFGAGGNPISRFTPTAATIVAGAAAYWTGMSWATVAATPTDPQGVVFSHDFDGRVILSPGQAAFLVGSVAQTGVFSASLMWQEVPV
jgi:hypothetical protein